MSEEKKKRKKQINLSKERVTLRDAVFRSADLKKIFNWFIAPVLIFFDRGQGEYMLTPERLIDLYFLEGRRRNVEFKVVTAINKLPGIYKPASQIYIEGYGKRYFPIGYKCMIVIDQGSSWVDLEFYRNWKTDKSFNFRLTRTEFSDILPFLEQIDIRRKKGR